MTYINILKTPFNFIKTYLKEITLTTVVASMVILIPVNTQKNSVYPSRITLNTNSANPLTVANAKTEIEIGISNNDISELNQNPNPTDIKSFMCAIAPEYGVDWKLVYAIGYHESGNYSSSLAKRNNNYFGRKASSGGYASWSTPEDAIRNQFAYIKNMYYSRGLTTPAAINPIYAEDSSWRVAVQSVMNTL